MRLWPVLGLLCMVWGMALPAAAKSSDQLYAPADLLYYVWSEGTLETLDPPEKPTFEPGMTSARDLFPADLALPALEPLQLQTLRWSRLDDAGRVIEGGLALRFGDDKLRFGALAAYQELWNGKTGALCNDQGFAKVLATADSAAKSGPRGAKAALRLALAIQYLINCGAEAKIMREGQWELTRQQLAACTDLGWFTCADALSSLLSYMKKDPGFAGVDPLEYPNGVSRILQRVAFFLTDAARCEKLPLAGTAAALEQIAALVPQLISNKAIAQDALTYIAGRQADLPVKKQDCP